MALVAFHKCLYVLFLLPLSLKYIPDSTEPIHWALKDEESMVKIDFLNFQTRYNCLVRILLVIFSFIEFWPENMLTSFKCFEIFCYCFMLQHVVKFCKHPIYAQLDVYSA